MDVIRKDARGRAAASAVFARRPITRAIVRQARTVSIRVHLVETVAQDSWAPRDEDNSQNDHARSRLANPARRTRAPHAPRQRRPHAERGRPAILA